MRLRHLAKTVGAFLLITGAVSVASGDSRVAGQSPGQVRMSPGAVQAGSQASGQTGVPRVTGTPSTVAPSGRLSWEEMRQIDRAKGGASREPKVTPYMKGPGAREVGESSLAEVVPDALIVTPDHGAVQTPPLTTSFEAIPDNGGGIPPDTHGAVGLNHVMTMLNTQVRIQDRTGFEISTVNLETFWSPVESGDVFDPKLMYDPGADRWLATAMADRRSASSDVLFAISDSQDATGTWTFYRFDGDPTNVDWVDFPDMGFNDTWIAITANMFGIVSGYSGVAMWVIDKSTVLSGGAATMNHFPAGFDLSGGYDAFTLRICQTFGPEPNLYIVDNSGWQSGGTHMLRISMISGFPHLPYWSVVPGSFLLESGLFRVDNNFSTSHPDALQPGTSSRINTNDDRMLNAVFRNGSIWCTHSGGYPVSGTDRTAIFWYQLDPNAMPNPIQQSGVIDGGGGVFHYFPSIAVNKNDDALVGFTRSSPSIYAQAAYTARLASDPPGSMDTVSVLKLGEDTYVKDYNSGRIRWGDYSATVVDPLNDLSFWTLQEYAATDVGPNEWDDRWGTWWGNANVDPNDLDSDGFPNESDNCPLAYNVDQTDSDGDGAGDACDVCVDVYDPDQLDTDGDRIGDLCDDCPTDPTNDVDNDGACGLTDNCPTYYNPDQGDGNGNGIGDFCECSSPNLSYYGTFAGERLGYSVGRAGDVNGDGIDDLIVGRHGGQATAIDSGNAYVYSGGDGALLYHLTGEKGRDWFGHAVTWAGDINDDGYDDFAVSALAYDGASSNIGRVYVFLGSPGPFPISLTGADAFRTMDGDALSDVLGSSMATIGDLDGDAIPELIVGASQYAGVPGFVRVYDGASGSVVTTLTGETAGDEFGFSVAGIGDVDGDVIPDFAVGAPGNDAAGNEVGRAYIYSGATQSLLWTYTGEGVEDRFGQMVAAAGDVNGDGRADFIIGAPFNDVVSDNAGMAYLYSGLDSSLMAVHTGRRDNDNFGSAAASLGDLNGDGLGEYVITAPQSDTVTIFTGHVSSVYYDYARGDGTTAFGVSVTGEPDLNGDGMRDMVVGEYWNDETSANCGAAHIYLMGDADSDSWPANCDNCPTAFNPSQSDGDGNGAGDACDCFCPCHGDPVCDGVVNVLDVVMAVNAAFRGDDPVTDPGCPRAQTDVSCDGFTNVLDVVKYVNVAFRSGDPATEFCDPCVF